MSSNPLDSSICLVKPSAFSSRELIQISLREAGFSVLASRVLTLNRPQAHRIYYEIANSNPDFSSIIDHICSGPIVVFHLQKKSNSNSNSNCNSELLELLGPIDPNEARITSPNSLRAIYGKDKIQNGLHSPMNELAVHNELDCFFHTEPKRIILFGPPSSGKGTQCDLLRQAYDIVHISTGDLLREYIRLGTEIGLQAKKYMEAGELVPDSLITDICLHRLSQHDCATRGWILDGFPRTAAQTQSLIDAGIKVNRFVFLNANRDKLIERACGRRLDPETGKIYHLKFNPPQNEKILSRLIQRTDDKLEVVQARLELYFNSIDGVVKQFNNIHIVNDGGIWEVFHQLVKGICEAKCNENQSIRNSSASGRTRLKSNM